jgi:hypothetical protein
MIIPGWVKWVALAALVATLMGFGYYIKGVIAENEVLTKQMDAAIKRIDTAEADNKRQDEMFAQRDAAHTEVRDGIADVTVRIQQESSRDPNTRAVLATRLPDGLRNAIREAAAARSAAQRESVDSGNQD